MTTAPKKTASPELKKALKATALLRADHKVVSGLFTAYEVARNPALKKEIVARICSELTVHAQVEEEIFYPVIKQAIGDHVLVPEALVKHATIKALIGQLEGIQPNGEMFDARVAVLTEYVRHHVKKEETEMFPKVETTDLDLMALGQRIAARKAVLLARPA